MGTKLDRKDVKIFAENSDATLITEFRTESADGSTASFSRDPDVIQNANYEQGWVENQNNLNTKIFGEDLNAVSYVQSYLLKYLYENGIPEWSPTTEYFEHSIARVDDKLYISLTDNNINNDPENTVGEWAAIPLSAINIITSGTGSSILNTSSGNNITLKSLSVDGYASLQDNGDQINIHVIGGSGIVDAYWGQIQGTLTNQADLVSALGDKQDTLTFDSPLSVDVNNEVSIPKATDSISGYLDSSDFQTFAGKQNALSGFAHLYDTDTDTAEIYPTATNSNIGTNTYPITNAYVNNVHCKTKLCVDEIDERTGDTVSVSSKLSVSGDTSVGGNLSVTGTTSTDKIQGLTTATSVETGASIVPDADNTYSLGSSSNAFNTIYVNKLSLTASGEIGAGTIESPRFKVTDGTNGLNIGYGSATPVNTNNSFNLGSSTNKFGTLWINDIRVASINNDNNTGSSLDVGHKHLTPSVDNDYALGYLKAYKLVYSYSFSQASDIRNKEDVKEFSDSVLDKLKSVSPITYKIKGGDGETKLGLSAQELQQVEPICVKGDAKKSDEKLSVDLYSLATLSIKAIKELNEKVEKLEARIEVLEKEKEELKK